MMWIEVKIPYEPRRALAFAYNRAMETAQSEWVLLLDHDVFLALNPHWYEMCLAVIEGLEGTKAALVTCMTGGTQRRQAQRVPLVSNDFETHQAKAIDLWEKYGCELEKAKGPITGFFMLVKKDAWKKILFADQRRGINNVDTDFCERLLKKGYEIYVMKGLYVFHKRKIRKHNYGNLQKQEQSI